MDTVAVPEDEGESVAESVGVPVGDELGESEAVAVFVGEIDSEGEPEAVTQPLVVSVDVSDTE